jgi:hypothetical protein
MKKILGLTVAAVFLAVAMLAFAAPQAPSNDITFTCKKGNVTFSHVKHAAVASDCKVCHHKWNGEGTPKKCDECHKEKKEGKTPKMKDAAHKKCKGCHRDMKKAGKKTGPTPCKGCHKK